MPDPDRDPNADRTTDPRYDDWPVQRDEAYTDWPVERPLPDEDGAAPERIDEIEWVGVVGGGTNAARPILYDPDTPAVLTGELDDENERVVLGEDHERHDLESGDSLGEFVESFGEERGWTWLSSFARTYLEDDEGRAPDGPALQHTEFDRRMLADSVSQDIGFFGSHTFTDATGRVYTLEREFDVFLEESDGVREPDGVRESDGIEETDSVREADDIQEATGERAVVAVDETLLVAREPREEDRAGDAEIVDENEAEFEVALDADDQTRERELERVVHEWHTDRYELPKDV